MNSDAVETHQSAQERPEEMSMVDVKYNVWPGVVKQLYSTGRNHNVIERLPRLPARNVYASDCNSVMTVSICSCGGRMPHGIQYRTLRGSSRVKNVTNGM